MGLKILHIADLHWRGITRHEEYTRSFEALFEHVKQIKPDIVFIGGDIFHTKTQGISPEVIEKMVWMFRELGNLVPTHVILGNHDGNLANEDRQDAISPLLHALDHPNVFLYKRSGVYPVGGYPETVMEGFQETTPRANFCVFSCFDKDGWSRVHPEAGDDVINIATYHGSISGCETDSNWVMKEGEEDVNLFTGFDFGMLGDIHKQQWIASRPDMNGRPKPWVAYPGSMIQQNFGEDERKGFLVWDIRSKHDWDVRFVELENKQPFVTIPWKGSVQDTLDFIRDTRGVKAFLPGTRFRVSSSNSISQLETRQLQSELKDIHHASELTFKFETPTKVETIQTNSVRVHKTSLRNDIHTLQQLYREFLFNNSSRYSLTGDQIDTAQTIIAGYLAKFNASEADSPRDVTWSIKKMEFDNLFRYGENNTIDFEKLEGIVGVFGSNRIGKSSIVGSMMYGLFNTTDRGPLKNGNIINYNKREGNARLFINVGGNDYIIQRASKRADPPKRKGSKVENFDLDKTTTELNLCRVQSDGTLLPLNSVTRDDTDKEIRRLIGKPEDFLLTAFSNQGGINRFIEEGATQRKAILNRFLDLDLFERLFTMAKDDYTLINNKTAKFTTNTWDVAIKTTEKSLSDKDALLEELEGEIAVKRTKVDNLRLWIMANQTSNTNDVDPKELETVRAKIKKSKLDLALLDNDQYNVERAIESFDKQLVSDHNALAQIDIIELRKKHQTMQGIEEKVRELGTLYKEQDTVLQTQEKSVKKLATVPCGDQFPECRFIKDSHEDKKLIEKQKVSVKDLLTQLNSVSDTLKLYQEEKLHSQISHHEMMTRNMALTESKLETNRSKLETIMASKSRINLELSGFETKETELVARLGQLASTEYETKKISLEMEQKDLSYLESRRNTVLVTIGSEKAKLDQLKRDQTESVELLAQLKVYETIRAAFDKNGIPAMILKTQLPAINLEIAKLLSNVVDFKITLETDISSNVMDVFLEDAISRRIIELASGMEKMIASLALRVALINLSSLPKPDIFIIDEGFGVLDDEGIQKCMQLLSIMKDNFKTILVISHVSAIKEVADRIIEISNLGLESRIEV